MKKKIVGLLWVGLLTSCTTYLPGETPEQFSLLEPQDGEVIEGVTDAEVPVVFSWETPSTADYYIITLQSTDATSQVLLDSIIDENSVRLELPANTEMNWLVSAVNGLFKSNSLETHRLQIGEVITVDEVVEEPLEDEPQNVAPFVFEIIPN